MLKIVLMTNVILKEFPKILLFKKSRTLKSKFKLGIMSSVLNLNAKV